MSRLPRNTDPKYIRHISIRTECARLWLLPDATLNQIIGGIIAKYQEQFSIVIYAYTVLSNHLHIVARAPEGNLWSFEQAVNREIAKRVNRLRNIRGHFWERRYDEQIVTEDSDGLEAFLYVTCNAVNHGLVEHPVLWPGLNSFAHSLDGGDRLYKFTDYTNFGKACRQAKGTGERVSIREFQTEHRLKITPLPEFESLNVEERRVALLVLIKQRVGTIKKERKQKGLGFMGRERILKQRPNQIPREVKRLPRPICYAKSWEAKKRFMAWFFPWLESFREASRKFRAGELGVKFPPYSILPPYHYRVSER